MTSFATLLGGIARTRSMIPGHGPQPIPTMFAVGSVELSEWRSAYGVRNDVAEASRLSDLPIEPEARRLSHEPSESQRRAWTAGQQCSGRKPGPLNPYKIGTGWHTAWQQGFEGMPLDLSGADCLKGVTTSENESAGLVASAPSLTDSDFDLNGGLPVPTWKRTAGEDRGSRLASEATDTPADSFKQAPDRMNAVTTSASVELLAIDFLNILVRCFHVGAPSEVHGVKNMLLTVAKIIRTLKPRRVVFAADGGYAHRTELLATYKAHRPPKPEALSAQIELAETAIAAIGWPLIRVAGYEADDVLASLVCGQLSVVSGQSQTTTDNGPLTTIVSTDKDLLQLLPRCRIWNPFGDAGGWQTAETVQKKFGCHLNQLSDWLALVGDSSDGIPGVNGIGKETATKLLAQYGDIESIIAQAALNNIKGALGTKLKSAECLKQIELSRALLKLVETLDVAEASRLSSDAGRIRHGWQQRLQDLRLFAAIKPLTEAFESPSSGGLVPPPTTDAPTATRPPRPVAKSLF